MTAIIRQIEDALADAFRRKGCDIVTKDGDRYARFYDHSTPSEHGGWEIAAEVSLYGIAIDVERALS